MICEKYSNLSPTQRIILIGQIVHAIQCDDVLFEHANRMIELATIKGVFDGVVILPPPNEPEHVIE